MYVCVLHHIVKNVDYVCICVYVCMCVYRIYVTYIYICIYTYTYICILYIMDALYHFFQHLKIKFVHPG